MAQRILIGVTTELDTITAGLGQVLINRIIGDLEYWKQLYRFSDFPGVTNRLRYKQSKKNNDLDVVRKLTRETPLQGSLVPASLLFLLAIGICGWFFLYTRDFAAGEDTCAHGV